MSAKSGPGSVDIKSITILMKNGTTVRLSKFSFVRISVSSELGQFRETEILARHINQVTT